MAITNVSKPTTSLSNSAKVSIGETWATWDTAWEDETRTWQELSQLLEDESKPNLFNYIKTLSDYYAETNGGTNWVTYGPDYTKEMQSFTSIGGILNSVKFYLKRQGTTTGNIVATLYAHTGTYGNGEPTGSALATSGAIAITALTTSFALVEFTFTGANRIQLTAGTKYFIGYEFTGGNSGSNLVSYIDGSSPTHDGNAAEWNGTSWDVYGGYDLPFYIYEDVTSPIITNISKP